LKIRWGWVYPDADLAVLERKYSEFEGAYNLSTPASINNVRILCKLDLKANDAIDNGDYDGASKLLR
jgi:hypothetical protein